MIDRRDFLKSAAVLASTSSLDLLSEKLFMTNSNKQISIDYINANFQREKLASPYGFKGNFLSELWQIVSQIKSTTGNTGTGIATQSVLYADSDLFVDCTEAEGNALMFLTVNKALHILKENPFKDPIELMDRILPEVHSEAKRITQKTDLNINFVYNALVSVDNAVWLLYAKENKFSSFDSMLPEAYRKTLSHRNKKIAIMCAVSYNTPMEVLKKEVEDGYFVIKIKTGAPGTQEEMVEADMKKLTEIHQTLKNYRTDQTRDGKLIYTLDANGRYEKKATLVKYLEHAKSIGAFDQIILCEEPLAETNTEHVGDLGVLVAADESVHNEKDALRKIELGYGGFVLKGIAKTLSQTLKIAKLAYDRNLPCACADLTVNPVLLEWNKNIASRLAPFPGLGMGLLETNGNVNYEDWNRMKNYHPHADASWTEVKNGTFELNDDFFEKSGGIFTPSTHYQDLLNNPIT
ncbi:enolase C-terminal domain-like protein [Albibacterium indicum]|uniref:enolase C-terminal domain-like protein n=1 Tax=Albibacterium indicum TaxID=2292082 RepID=UPI000E54D0E0|nr:enolase C-terminal domain-like protein [Pedobacter indicus]